MITVKKEGVVLEQTNLEFENEGVLNPAIIREGDNIHLFYRAVRKGNFSTIGYCKLDTPLTVAERLDVPLLVPQFDYEKHGMEDSRIVKIGEVYYLSYIAFDGINALGAVATSTDLQHFEKHGIIVPQITYAEFDELVISNNDFIERYRGDYNGADTIVMDKDLVFFPRRINGKLTFLHRIKPDIQIAAVNGLNELTAEYWKNYLQHFRCACFACPQI